MRHIAMPEERMHDFLSKLDIAQADVEIIDTYGSAFVARKEEFGHMFYSYFHAIPTTRIILDHCNPADNLRTILTRWFGELFVKKMNTDFLRELWQSGLRHVELSLDQRFVNLGYAVVRNFCHRVIGEDIPVADRAKLASAVDKYLDFCVLVATDSFISATSRCDREVILGIAHQVRNPTTIIGGGVKRLQKKLDVSHPDHRIYEAILQENQRLERMVSDIGRFTALFQDDPRFGLQPLSGLIEEALKAVGANRDMKDIRVDPELDPSVSSVFGDRRDLITMLYCVLENAVEAVAGAAGTISIQASKAVSGSFVVIRIVNPGTLPANVAATTLFEPFYSSKPTGTGFGLAIAALAVKKNLGDITIEQQAHDRVCVSITLPLSEGFSTNV